MRKRFIAGAICPKCSSKDRIVTYQLDEKQYIECVVCDFKKSNFDDEQPVSKKSQSNEIVVKWPIRKKKSIDE